MIKFFRLGLLGIALVSCATEQAAGNYLSKYQAALAKYQAKEYYDALQLFQEVIPLLKGRKEIILAQFYQAYAFFYEKSYKKSAYCFEQFYKTYPRVEQAEEALYMQGYSLYLDTPGPRVDSTRTEKALAVLRLYLEMFPTGVYQEQVQRYSVALKNKLACKDFNSAKLYYQLGYYRAAVITLTNFQNKYNASPYHEKAAYLKAAAQYKLAEESTDAADQLSCLRDFIKYYYKFVDNYAGSKYVNRLERHYNSALARIDKLTTHK